MKQLTVVLLSTLLLVACKAKKDTPASIHTTSVREKELLGAIATYPDSLVLRENLIQYYRENGTYDMALATVNDAIKKDSTVARLWDIKAIVHYEAEDTINAIKAYEKAIDLFPEPEYIMSLGSLYAQTKNPKALVMADALLIGNKANADKEALFIKGLYFSYIGEEEKAIQFFDNSLALDYTFMYAYREKAIALYNLGKYENALAVLDKAITIQNSFDEGYYWAGRCLEKMNRTSEAIQSYQNAVTISPDYVEAKEALAKLGVK